MFVRGTTDWLSETCMMSWWQYSQSAPQNRGVRWFGLITFMYSHACGCKIAKLDYILKKFGPHSSSLTIRNRPNKNRLPDKCQLTHTETIVCLAITQFKRWSCVLGLNFITSVDNFHTWTAALHFLTLTMHDFSQVANIQGRRFEGSHV